MLGAYVFGEPIFGRGPLANGSAAPNADFLVANEDGEVTQYDTVQFYDASLGDLATSWAWDFDLAAGATTDSTLERPTHVYTSPGTYTVRLIATNAAGSTTVTRVLYITVASAGFEVEDGMEVYVNEPWNVYVLNLFTEAWTTFSNFKHKGAITPPPATRKKTWAVVNDHASNAALIDVDQIWSNDGADDVVSLDCVGGPNIYIQTKRHDAGDPTWLKKWKSILLHADANDGELNVEVIPYVESNVGTQVGDAIDEGDTDPTFRARFWKYGTHIGFRLYGDDALTSAKLGAMSVFFKMLRRERRARG